MASIRTVLATCILILQALPALALPQGITIPPSPMGRTCHLDEDGDHWECDPLCITSTTTEVGIVGTVTNLIEWQSSMDARYSRSDAPFSGETVFIHTELQTYPGGSFTAYGIYDSNALTSAGYSLITTTALITTCQTEIETETGALPPSPTGSICSPHVDHWHCEPSPTTEPSSEFISETLSETVTDTKTDSLPPSPTGSICTPHVDHWNCQPSPTHESATAPLQTTSEPTITSAPTATVSGTSAAASPSVVTAGTRQLVPSQLGLVSIIIALHTWLF